MGKGSERPGLLSTGEVLVTTACMRASRKADERNQWPAVLRWTATDRAAAVAVKLADIRATTRCWAWVR